MTKPAQSVGGILAGMGTSAAMSIAASLLTVGLCAVSPLSNASAIALTLLVFPTVWIAVALGLTRRFALKPILIGTAACAFIGASLIAAQVAF